MLLGGLGLLRGQESHQLLAYQSLHECRDFQETLGHPWYLLKSKQSL